MTVAAELVHRREHVLLDFDGPVCAVFGALSDQAVADRLRTFLPGALPAAIAATDDPFEVLGHAEMRSPDLQTRVETELTRLEVAAVRNAPDTPGAARAIRHIHDSGRTVTIVSNNSVDAVNAHLRSRDLAGYVDGVSARGRERPLMLKPHPHLLQSAMTSLAANPADCVMIGDSISDIHAAYRAHTAVIALADRPESRRRFESHHPTAVIDGMDELIA